MDLNQSLAAFSEIPAVLENQAIVVKTSKVRNVMEILFPKCFLLVFCTQAKVLRKHVVSQQIMRETDECITRFSDNEFKVF